MTDTDIGSRVLSVQSLFPALVVIGHMFRTAAGYTGRLIARSEASGGGVHGKKRPSKPW